MEPQYEKFTSEEFTRDPFFYEWVTAPTQRHDAFWAPWLRNHPEKEEDVHAARQHIQRLIAAPDAHLKDQMKSDWRRVKTAVDAEERPSRSRRRILQYAVAASLALIAVAVTQYFLAQQQNGVWHRVETAYGERRTLQLPDGSEVTLNGNSRLRYADSWNGKAGGREVWLDGEAFFEVTKKEIAETPVKFTVHAHHMDVEVLGTAFNVRTREQQTQVALTEGKVRALDKARNVLLLKPGELAEFNDRQAKLTKRLVNDSAFSSWRGDKITFDNDRIGEIFLWLRETYGYKIEIDDEALLQHRYTGSVPVNNVELLFDKIATLYQLEVRKEGKNIWFEKR